MTDFADQSAAQELHNLQVALSHKKPALAATGFCHWCKTKLVAESPALFCDTECRDDHEMYRRRNGGF